MHAVVFATSCRHFASDVAREVPFMLLPVAARPLAAHMAAWLAGQQAGRVTLVVEEGAGIMEKRLGPGERWGIELDCVTDAADQGLTASLRKLGRSLSGTVAVLPHPVLTGADLVAAWERHQAGTAGLTVLSCMEDVPRVLLVDKGLLHEPFARGAQGPEELAAACVRAGVGVEDVRLDAPVHGVTDIASLYAANMDVLMGRMSHLITPETERSPGVRVGPGSRIHPQAEIRPPVIIGPETQVGAGARIGPRTVVGASCLVDTGAVVEESVVLDGTYVGVDITIGESLARHSFLARPRRGTVVEVPDVFMLGRNGGPAQCGWCRTVFNRVGAVAAMVLFSPILAWMGLRHLAGGGGHVRGVEVVGGLEPGLAGDEGLVMVRLHRAGRGSGFYAGLAGLADVAAGRLHLVGIEPLSREAAGDLRQAWETLRYAAGPGLVHPWHALGQSDPAWEEKRVMEGAYAASQSLAQDVGILARAAWRRLFGAGSG
jgi:NDP-sugar pyrophosphorylase family protein